MKSKIYETSVKHLFTLEYRGGLRLDKKAMPLWGAALVKLWRFPSFSE